MKGLRTKKKRRFLMAGGLIILLGLFSLPSISLGADESVSAVNAKDLYKQADVVLDVIPLKVRPISRGSSVDVIENDVSRLPFVEAVVSFKLKRVLKGNWIKEKLGGPSRFAQMQTAAKNRNVFKMIGLDFTDPEEEVLKEWLSVAVEDPGKVFGINNWESPGSKRLKLYLKRQPENNNSFIMIGAVPR